MTNLILASTLSAFFATSVLAADLPYNVNLQFPSGPQGQVTTPYAVDVVATSIDLNGTITGSAEYIAYYAGGTRYSPRRFCADVYKMVWDSNGTLTEQTKTSVGCAPNRVGVFAPSYTPVVLSPTVYSQFGVYNGKLVWCAFKE